MNETCSKGSRRKNAIPLALGVLVFIFYCLFLHYTGFLQIRISIRLSAQTNEISGSYRFYFCQSLPLFPTTLRFQSFEQNRTPVFSIRIPSTNFDFIRSKSKFDTIKVVMEF